MNRRPLKRPMNFQRPPQAKVGHWYEIRNISADVADMSIYDEIGYWGVTASELVRELQGVSAKTINLHINSPGGDVWDGLAILNALRQHAATINVTIDGIAASAASFIAMAGDTVQIAPQAMIMIHDASGMVYGNAEDMTEMASLLDKTSGNIAAVYAQRAGKDTNYWRDQMRVETWYTDQEAVDAGLADSILGSAVDPEEPAVKARVTPAVMAKKAAPAAPVPVVDQAAEPSEVPVVMPTTADPLAAWDLTQVRAAITAAKEATTHG